MSLPISDVSVLPGRCVLFLTDAFTGGPVEAVPVGLGAKFQVSAGSASTASGPPTSIGGGSSGAPSPEPPISDVLLGVLSTDHVGYASWDLSLL